MDHSQAQLAPSFGGLLRILRQSAHLTQRELANIVGYSDAQINRYEKGVRMPDPSIVAALFVNALGLEHESETALRLINLARKPAQIATETIAISSKEDQQLRSKLPLPTTDLLGRDLDLTAALEILGRNNVRTLTLVGPPGVGKTRLAIQLAVKLANQYQQGAIFVPLAAIMDGSLIADAMLQAMGVTSNTQNPLVQLKNVLHQRNIFLVLDNFEHLLDFSNANTAAGIVAELVAIESGIKVLITSRAPLHISGEHLYEVPSLPPTAARDLFVSRATALSPTFKPRPYDEQAIADICRRLDYLPLAIELAAARIRVFDPPALLKRLTVPLTFLTNGPKDLPHRQRALKSAIDWSYDLLTLEEQTLFRRLSIFADGCTMTMIEAIIGGDLTSPVVDIVQSLVDKSILKSDLVNGKMRFSLLEMLREYASELLASSTEAETAIRTSAQWFVNQVQMTQNDPATSTSAAWFEWFDTELNNLRAVIQWSMQSDHIEYGLQLAANLGVTWRLHGPLRDGFQLISQLLAHPRARKHACLYAQVLLSAANVTRELGEMTLSHQYLIEALDMGRQSGDQRQIAWALSYLGAQAWSRAEYVSARTYLEESIALFRKINDQKGLAWALLWLGTIDRDQGHLAQALTIYEEVTQIAHTIKSVVMSYLAAGWTSSAFEQMGDLGRARELAETALEICRANGLIGSMYIMHEQIAGIALSQEDVGDAIYHATQAAMGSELHGSRDMRAGALVKLGFATHLNGDASKAKALLRESLQVLWKSQRYPNIPEILNRLGWMAIDGQDFARGVRLMSAAKAAYKRLSIAIPFGDGKFHHPRLETAKANLTQQHFELLWCEGQVMDYKAAVTYALD